MSIIIDDAGVNGADGKNVYVGNLSWETDDAQLLELVSQYGTVTSAHVETSKSGRSLGYGLVAYASEADASYAIEQLDELEFGGRKIRVRVDRGPTAPKAKKERAPREQRPRRERVPLRQSLRKMSIIIDDAGVNGADGKNVYVGNLSWETDDAQLLELVSQYGTVTSAHVETSKSGRSLGYGLVAYASEADASYAIEQLDELDFGGRKIRVRVDRGPTAPKAKKERAPREQRPRRERVPDEDKVVEPTKVFVMNLNFDTTEDELADHCASYGSVVAAELLTRGRNNRPSGSAIVEYSADHEAKAAIAGLEGQELGGRPLRVREYYSA